MSSTIPDMKLLRDTNRAVLAAFVLLSVGASTPIMALEVGDDAPEFLSIDQNGKLWNTEDVYGQKNIVIYFYPAAMTGGCTKQACAYRDNLEALESEDTIVLGVSGDDPASLKIFEQSHDLNFTLLADFDGKIAKLFGVPTGDGGVIERVFEDTPVKLNRGVTSSRWTFIIGKNKKALFKNTKVNAADDSNSAIEFLKSLE